MLKIEIFELDPIQLRVDTQNKIQELISPSRGQSLGLGHGTGQEEPLKECGHFYHFRVV